MASRASLEGKLDLPWEEVGVAGWCMLRSCSGAGTVGTGRERGMLVAVQLSDVCFCTGDPM